MGLTQNQGNQNYILSKEPKLGFREADKLSIHKLHCGKPIYYVINHPNLRKYQQKKTEELN